MRDDYDFSNAIKNPYAQRLKKGYTIVIEHEDYDEVITVKRERREKRSEGASEYDLPKML